MNKLEFLVRAFTLQNDALKSLADNQKELFHAIVELKDRGEWVGLTDEEMEQCYESIGNPINDWALGRAIEAKLKEKNE